jgi:hypothetical protein
MVDNPNLVPQEAVEAARAQFQIVDEVTRHYIDLALGAAAPLIRAAALEEAANEFEVDGARYGEAEEWLRLRASELRSLSTKEGSDGN